jgi:hypothetical protein
VSVFERPLKVGKTDNFTLTLDDSYLAGEVISSVNVSTENTDLTIDSFTHTANVISGIMTGNVAGKVEVHFEWVLPSTRSGCSDEIVIVLDC